jgi:hypothetical protein
MLTHCWSVAQRPYLSACCPGICRRPLPFTAIKKLLEPQHVADNTICLLAHRLAHHL